VRHMPTGVVIVETGTFAIGASAGKPSCYFFNDSRVLACQDSICKRSIDRGNGSLSILEDDIVTFVSFEPSSHIRPMP